MLLILSFNTPSECDDYFKVLKPLVDYYIKSNI